MKKEKLGDARNTAFIAGVKQYDIYRMIGYRPVPADVIQRVLDSINSTCGTSYTLDDVDTPIGEMKEGEPTVLVGITAIPLRYLCGFHGLTPEDLLERIPGLKPSELVALDEVGVAHVEFVEKICTYLTGLTGFRYTPDNIDYHELTDMPRFLPKKGKGIDK